MSLRGGLLFFPTKQPRLQGDCFGKTTPALAGGARESASQRHIHHENYRFNFSRIKGRKMKLRISLLALSAILVAAHFLRYGELIPVLLCLAAPFLLLIKKRWALVAVQLLTVVAAIVWMFALYDIIQQRIFEGDSWAAAAIILGSVAGYTLLTGWLLESPLVKGKYP